MRSKSSKDMLNQVESVLKIVAVLKENKVPISSVEKELGFSNGVIGKAAKGIAELSDEKMSKLQNYFDEHYGSKITNIEIKSNAETVVEELKPQPAPKVESPRRTPTKMERLSETMAQINKKYGDGTVMFLGDKPNREYKTISTGSIGLDYATGIGGFPLGRMVEVMGWESSGKSTIALNVVANAQKKNLRCLWVDAENAFDTEYAEALGVNTDILRFTQPSCGEFGFSTAEDLINAGEIDVIVFDSVAAMLPKAEVEGAVGDSKMGLHARLMSQTCRKLNSLLNKRDVLLIFINQFREKIGVTFGSPEVPTGGNALKFFASMRVVMRRSEANKNMVLGENDEKEGALTSVKVIKNKCSAPYKTAQFNIMFGKGIDVASEILGYGVQVNVLTRNGTHYSYGGNKIGQGREEAHQFLEDNAELAAELQEKILEKLIA